MDQTKLAKDFVNSYDKVDIDDIKAYIVYLSAADYIRFEAVGIVRRSSVHDIVLKYHKEFKDDDEPLVYSVLTDKFLNT